MANTADKANAAGKTEESSHRGLFGPDGFTFKDFLDIINPLQHIPIVSTVYRAMTGDEIEAGPRIAGDTLFGGPIGLAVAVVSGMVQEATGKDPGEQAMALLGIDLGGDKNSQTAVAEADAQPQPDRVPPELLAAMQPPPRQDLKMSVKMADQADREGGAGQPEDAADADASAPPAAAPATPIVQPASQSAPAITPTPAPDNPAAVISARARGLPPGARVTASAGHAPPQVVDGRAWFPAFPQGGGGAPVRSVGTQPVTQQNVDSKFGVKPDGYYKGAAFRSDHPPPTDWAERATAAYQKYFDMQGQRKQRSTVDVAF